MTALPIVMSSTGYVPQTPTALNTQLINTVTGIEPNFTANLPGSMIEDMSSTVIFAELQLDSSIAEILASVSPFAANAFLEIQLGNVYGTAPIAAFNTSVLVQFAGPAGFFVMQGFVIGDGTNQYVVQTGQAILSSGLSPLMQVVSPVAGSFPVPPNTVNQIITSVPTGITLTVNNPNAGTPGVATGEDETSFRARTLQAGLATTQGVTRYLKTQLQAIPGVQANLVSVKLVTINSLNFWEVIVGGSASPFAIGAAIFQSLFDIPNLTGSVMFATNISNANPAVVTTDLFHGFQSNQIIQIEDAAGGSFGVLNNQSFEITVLSPTSFSIPVNTTTFGTYLSSSGQITPNLRNVFVDILDFPDVYQIPYVNPPQQAVDLVGTWDTPSSNLVNPAAVSQLALQPIVNYVNSIEVGQPINLLVLNSIFQNAVASILPISQLTTLSWTVSINGVSTPPSTGTSAVQGDPESFYFMTTANVTLIQG
jgi:Ubiquitin-activating enzyme E1 FCCH domain